MAICAVIFDLDGVLIDSASVHRESWKLLGDELGADVCERTIAATFGRRNRDTVPILFGDQLTPQEVRRLGLRKEQIYRELVREALPLTEGAVALARYYKDHGYQLAIASSAPRANIDLALEVMDLQEAFEVIISGDDVSVGKPDPTVFLTAAARLGLEPAQCMVIEDAPAGITAAQAAKMPVVALLGSFPVEKLRHANRVIRQLDELIPA